MENQPQLKEIVTVAELARMVGLSRTRFYSLVSEGVMPLPSRNPQTGRPFYTRQQQEQCLLVRRCNCGANGQPVLFYARALKPPQLKMPKRPTTQSKSNPQPQTSDPLIEDLRHGLSQLGMVDVTDAALRAALAECYPDGHREVDPASLLMTVLRHLKRQNPNDKVA